MKHLLALLIIPFAASAADVAPKNEWTPSWQNPADGFQIKVNPLGSGSPAKGLTEGVDVAAPVADGYYHVPGYLPGHPTAATIWPTLKQVDCTQVGEKFVCDGYQVNQATGRGEYVYVVPNVKYEPPKETQPPLVIMTPEPQPMPTPPKKPKKPRPPKKPKVTTLQCK